MLTIFLKTRRWYVSRPPRDRDVETETTTLSPVHTTLIQWIIRFDGNTVVLSQAATKNKKNIPKFKDALQLIRSVLTKKAIDNDVKDYRKRLQACDVCQRTVDILNIEGDNSYNRYQLLYLNVI